MKKLGVEDIIEQLGLEPLPVEGGYFRVIFTADEHVKADALPERYDNSRTLGGTIYFLETP